MRDCKALGFRVQRVRVVEDFRTFGLGYGIKGLELQGFLSFRMRGIRVLSSRFEAWGALAFSRD